MSNSDEKDQRAAAAGKLPAAVVLSSTGIASQGANPATQTAALPSETPRTDIEEWVIPDYPASISHVVYAKFTRTLEIEAAALRRELAEAVAIMKIADANGYGLGIFGIKRAEFIKRYDAAIDAARKGGKGNG